MISTCRINICIRVLSWETLGIICPSTYWYIAVAALYSCHPSSLPPSPGGIRYSFLFFIRLDLELYDKSFWYVIYRWFSGKTYSVELGHSFHHLSYHPLTSHCQFVHGRECKRERRGKRNKKRNIIFYILRRSLFYLLINSMSCFSFTTVRIQ